MFNIIYLSIEYKFFSRCRKRGLKEISLAMNMIFDIPIDEKFAREIINKFGVVPQLDMTVEECAELIKSVLKLKRRFSFDEFSFDNKKIVRNPRSTDKTAVLDDYMSNLADEIADVLIMISQISHSLCIKDEIDDHVMHKIDRLSARLRDL